MNYINHSIHQEANLIPSSQEPSTIPMDQLADENLVIY